MGTENPCLTCTNKYCTEFKITTEFTNPNKLSEILQIYPFIKRVGFDIILWQGHERAVGIYSCERFDKETGLCRDYNVRDRPVFCHNTGEKIKPSSVCKYLAS